MNWILIISLTANAILVYSLLSTKKQLREYMLFCAKMTVQMDEMREIIKGYDKVIHDERAQLQYIPLGYMQKEEILALEERSTWLQ